MGDYNLYDEVDRKNDEIEFIKVERTEAEAEERGAVTEKKIISTALHSYMGCWWKLWQFTRRNKLTDDDKRLFEVCKIALTKAAVYENLAADMQELLFDHCANCKDNDTYFCHCKCKWHYYDTDNPYCEEDDKDDDDGRST